VLIGIYTSILETDNRLALPDEVLANYKDSMYITRGFDRNVMALTTQAFEAVYHKLTALNLADSVSRLLLRMLLSSAHHTEMTPDGKIHIPTQLKEFAGLKSNVLLVGQGDFIELWSPEIWKTQEEQFLITEANRFSSLNITTR
jgi:MraZ protein